MSESIFCKAKPQQFGHIGSEFGMHIDVVLCLFKLAQTSWES